VPGVALKIVKSNSDGVSKNVPT